jgi:hypothetical protein
MNSRCASAALFTPIRPYADTVFIFGCGSAVSFRPPPSGQVLAGGFSIFRFFCGDFALHLVLIILKIHTL